VFNLTQGRIKHDEANAQDKVRVSETLAFQKFQILDTWRDSMIEYIETMSGSFSKVDK